MMIFLVVCAVAALAFLLNGQEKLKAEIKSLKERLARLEGPTLTAETAAPRVVQSPGHLERRGPPETPKAPQPPPTPPRPEAPRPPAPPPAIVLAIQRFFTGGNLVVRLGVVVLFFGVAFLLKLAIAQGLIPIEVRLAAVAVAAIALMIAGWRLRTKRAGYALSLIGGAVGVLYLDVFAALRIYHLLQGSVAFGLLLLIVAFSSAIAILLKSQAIAVLGTCGGFLAPVLTSTGGGSHVQLFTYFLVLNLGILAIAWFRAWRPLNVLGFVFTFSLGLSWGSMYYQPAFFRSTEPFLIAFFLLYSLIPLLFAAKTKTYQKGFVDTTLAFGTPLVGFGLQAALVKDIPHGLAWSSLALAAYYLTIAWFLFKKAPAAFRALTEVFLAIGVVFVTLTIPLRLDHQWTCLSWALEGAALVWIGVRQGRLLARLFGILVLFAAGFAFRESPGVDRGLIVLNPYLLGACFVSFGAFFSSYYLTRDPERTTQTERTFLAPALLLWAWGWWFYGGAAEIVSRLSGVEREVLRLHAIALFVFASLGLFEFLQRRLSWRWLQAPVYFLLPFFAAALLLGRAFGPVDYHPVQDLGWAAWPTAFAVHLWFLRRNDKTHPDVLFKLLHAGWLWLLVFLALEESAWILARYFESPDIPAQAWRTWWDFTVGLFPVVTMALVVFFHRWLPWPIRTHASVYLHWGLAPVVVFLLYWLCRSFSTNGDTAVIPYLPILNPLELLQAFFFLSLFAWLRATEWRGGSLPRFLLGAFLFLWVNTLLARSVSHWAGVPYELGDLSASLVFQTALTIYWTILAMSVMVLGTQKRLRTAWMIGATLLGGTVLKMFLVDLSKTQTVARVVSFLGAGVLILLIGYFSPLPPKTQQKGAAT